MVLYFDHWLKAWQARKTLEDKKRLPFKLKDNPNAVGVFAMVADVEEILGEAGIPFTRIESSSWEH